jgi:hypothetical protein
MKVAACSIEDLFTPSVYSTVLSIPAVAISLLALFDLHFVESPTCSFAHSLWVSLSFFFLFFCSHTSFFLIFSLALLNVRIMPSLYFFFIHSPTSTI